MGESLDRILGLDRLEPHRWEQLAKEWDCSVDQAKAELVAQLLGPRAVRTAEPPALRTPEPEPGR